MLSFINHSVLSFAPIDSSARIVVLPSKSLIPPREDHVWVSSLYPSYCLVSVLNLIAPSCASSFIGLSVSPPQGMTSAVLLVTLTSLPVNAVNTRSSVEVVETTFSASLNLSLTLNLVVDLISPLVWITPVTWLIWIRSLTLIEPVKIVFELDNVKPPTSLVPSIWGVLKRLVAVKVEPDPVV